MLLKWPAGSGLAIRLAQGSFSTIGLFWIQMFFVGLCLFDTCVFSFVVQHLRFVNLQILLCNRILVICIFLYDFNL